MWSMNLRPGGKWSGVIARGKLIRFTALEEGANVSVLLYHAHNRSERYNMPDTLKAQHTAHLTTGHVLMSDNGRVLASIVEDSLGWHDTISGYLLQTTLQSKYGISRYQEQGNEWLHSAQENFAVELVRNDLGVRDIVPPINLFTKISADDDGLMKFHGGHCSAGATVTLRTEMDILLILSNTPNPLDPRSEYSSANVKIDVSPAAPVDAQDVCVNACPENQRAFENTWDYHILTLGSEITE